MVTYVEITITMNKSIEVLGMVLGTYDKKILDLTIL